MELGERASVLECGGSAPPFPWVQSPKGDACITAGGLTAYRSGAEGNKLILALAPLPGSLEDIEFKFHL